MIVLLLRLVLGAAVPVSAQAPAPGTPQPAGIEGRVTNLATGEPIRNVRFRLQLQSPADGIPSQFLANSDAAGKFAFENIEPGRYVLYAQRAGFVSQYYGTHSTARGGTPIVLDAGQRIEGLIFKLAPQGLIYGRVTDEEGEPAIGMQIEVYRLGFLNGRRQLLAAGAANLNPDSSFVIGNLTPGLYYLAARESYTQRIGPQPRAGTNGPEEGYVTTYYPGTTDAASASPIDVSIGAEVRGIEIRLRKAAMFRIRGRVSGLPAGPPRGIGLTLAPKNVSARTFFYPDPFALIKPDHTFEFHQVLPGDYIIRREDDRDTSLVCRLGVTVGNESLDNVQVNLTPSLQLNGVFKLDGAILHSPANPPFVRLTPVDSGVTSEAISQEDGSFRVAGLMPEKYRVKAGRPPQGAYVKSVRFNGQDVTAAGIDLSSAAAGSLEVLLSGNAAEIFGVASSGVSVSLWNEDETISATADQNGAFRFQNLAPGDYRLLAWEDIEPGLAQDADFRRRFESQAASVTLRENSRESPELKVIFKNAIDAEVAKLR